MPASLELLVVCAAVEIDLLPAATDGASTTAKVDVERKMMPRAGVKKSKRIDSLTASHGVPPDTQRTLGGRSPRVAAHCTFHSVVSGLLFATAMMLTGRSPAW